MQHFDVIVVGAGLSGIGAGCHLTRRLRGLDYAVPRSARRRLGSVPLSRRPLKLAGCADDLARSVYMIITFYHRAGGATMPVTIDQLDEKLNDLAKKLPPEKRPGSDLAQQIAVGVAAAVIIGLLTLFGNWASQGGLVRVLGGISKADLDDALKKIPSPSPVEGGSWKVELVAGEVSAYATKDDDGNFTAAAAQYLCPQGTILINAYCATNNQKASSGALRASGLISEGWFSCTWTGVDKPDGLRGQAQPMCLRMVKK
jgi:hypothetical protein